MIYAHLDLDLPTRPQYSLMPGEFLVLGRSSHADVLLPKDSAVSRLHCKIFHESGSFWLEDLGSRNGTLVNGAKVARRQQLNDGDRISVGRCPMRFSLVQGPDEPLVPPEQENFFLLKREDKLTGKIAAKLGLISREALKQCLQEQDDLSQEGLYRTLEEILLQGGRMDPTQFEEIERYKRDAALEIPGYELHELIALGGMGHIYRASSLGTGVEVVVKIFRDAADEGLRKQMESQFRREAQVLLQLKHPNIVSGIEFGDTADALYLAMEYIAGPTLQQYIKDKGGRLLPDEALEIFEQIVRALDHAHAHGLIHRDIKPENILLTNNRIAKLCDFGLVKNVGAEPGAAEGKEEKVFGTVVYMSPEQIRGEQDLDIRSDIYSLGAMTYRMVFGRIPFMGDSHSIRAQHVHRPVSFPETGMTSQKREFARVIGRMMSKERAGRYQNPSELLAEIEFLKKSFEQEEIGSTIEVPLLSKEARDTLRDTGYFQRRQRRSLGVLSVLAALAVLIASLWMIFHGTETVLEDYREVLAAREAGEDETWERQSLVFLDNHPESEHAPEIRRGLQAFFYRSALISREKSNLGECERLCLRALEFDGSPEIREEARNLLQRIREELEQEEAARQRQSFGKRIEALSHAEERDPKEVRADLGKLARDFPQFLADPAFVELRRANEAMFEVVDALARLDGWLGQGNLAEAEKAFAGVPFLPRHSQIREERKSRLEELRHRREMERYRYYSVRDLDAPASGLPAAEDPGSGVERLFPECDPFAPRPTEGVFFLQTAGYLYCLSADTGDALWSFRAGAHADFVLLRGWERVEESGQADRVLLSVPGTCVLRALALLSGETLWAKRLPAEISSAPLCRGKEVFLCCQDALCYRIDLEGAALLGAFRTPSVCRFRPWFDEAGVLHLAGEEAIYSFDPDKGSLRGIAPCGGKLESEPVPFGRHLLCLIRTGESSILRFLPKSGGKEEPAQDAILPDGTVEIVHSAERLFLRSEKGLNLLEIQSPPRVRLPSLGAGGYAIAWQADELLVIAGEVSLWKEKSSGIQPVWTQKSPPGRPTAPWQRTGSICFATTENGREAWASAFRVSAGEIRLLWQRRVGVPFAPSPILLENEVWLNSADGAVYRIEERGHGLACQNALPKSASQEALALVALPKYKKILALKGNGASLVFGAEGGRPLAWKSLEMPEEALLGAVQQGEQILSVVQRSTVSAFSLKTGKKLCHLRRPQGEEFTAHRFFRNSAFLGTRQGHCRHLNLRQVDKKFLWVTAWSFSSGGPIWAAPAVTERQLLVASGDGSLYSLDPLSGKPHWSFSSGAPIRSSPLLRRETACFGNDSGDLYAVRLNSGTQSWHHRMDGAIRVSPVESKGWIYAATDRGDCAAFDAETGERAWETRLEGGADSFLFAWKGRICAGSDNGFIYAWKEKAPRK